LTAGGSLEPPLANMYLTDFMVLRPCARRSRVTNGKVQIDRDLSAWSLEADIYTFCTRLITKLSISPLPDRTGNPMPIMTNNKHELFAHPDYECARWRRRHGTPGWLSFVRSFTSGRWPSVINGKFYANLAVKMDKGELNTVASELLEGISRADESRREQLETLSKDFKLLRLVIETAAATSVSFSAPLEGMSTLRHPRLREACSLIQANAVGEMLPAAVPVRVRNDRRLKSKGAAMMGHNDGPTLDGTIPFSTPPAASAGASYAGSPRPASALPAAVPPSSRRRRDAPSRSPIARPAPRDGCACRSLPCARCWAGRLLAQSMPGTLSFRKSKSATRSRTLLKRA
jgi:hypothetical protein